MGKLVTELNHFGTDYRETELEAGLLWAALMKLEKKNIYILESENSKREGLMLLINYNVLGFTN